MRPKLMSWKDVSKYIYYSDVLIVDLRDPGEYKKGHIRGAWNIPYEELEGRMKQLRGYKRVILYCDYGNQSMEAARTLAADGWQAATVVGGYETLQQNDIDGYEGAIL